MIKKYQQRYQGQSLYLYVCAEDRFGSSSVLCVTHCTSARDSGGGGTRTGGPACLFLVR